MRPLVGLDKELNRNRIVNKSHAAAYAVISIRTAWLKYHYPVVFWTETLNSVINKADKIRKYLYCAQKHGMTIMQPSVNNSATRFSYEGNNIYIGLSALRDLGKASLPIIEERNLKGKYKSFEDFVERCKPGKKVLTALAYSGGLDEFGFTRKEIIENIETISNYLANLTKYDSWADFEEINNVYRSLISLELNRFDEYSKQEKLQFEYNYAGMYVSEHPLDDYMVELSLLKPSSIADLTFERDENEEVNYRKLRLNTKVVGILKDVETKITRNGDTMVVGTIEDKTGDLKFTVFSGVLSDPTFKKELLVENNIVLLDVCREVDDYGSKLNVFAINTIQSVEDNLKEIKCTTDMENYQQIVDVARHCEPGNMVVIINIEFSKHRYALVTLDADSDKLYTRKDRQLNDERNLRVSLSSYAKLKEVSKQITIK